MKKIILILSILTIQIFASNLKFENIQMKDLIYFLEKDGYQINYFLNNDKMIQLYNMKIKNPKHSTNIKTILTINFKYSSLGFKLKNKEIAFFPIRNYNKTINSKHIKHIRKNYVKSNKNKKIKITKPEKVECNFNKKINTLPKECKLEFAENILFYEKSITNLKRINDIIYFNLNYYKQEKNQKENKPISYKKLIEKIKYIFDNNFDLLLKTTININKKNINININQYNYKNILNILVNKDIKLSLDKIETSDFKYDNLENLEQNIDNTKEIMTQYENNLIKIDHLYDTINYPYFYKYKGKITYNKVTYYFIDDKIFNTKNFILDGHSCKISKKNKIVCYNENYEVKFK